MTKLDKKIDTDRAEFPTFELASDWGINHISGFPSWRVEESAPYTFTIALIPNDLYVSNEDVQDHFGDPFNAGTRGTPDLTEDEVEEQDCEPANSDEEPDQLAPGD